MSIIQTLSLSDDAAAMDCRARFRALVKQYELAEQGTSKLSPDSSSAD
jgi:hypothetical protein